MEELIDSISFYLADELSQSNFYNKEEVKQKIKVSLAILMDKKLENKHTSSLKSKVKSHIRISKRNEIELKFWKDSLRNMIGEENMGVYYKVIDKKLIEQDLK